MFPGDGLYVQQGGAVTYSFDLETPWAGWKSPGGQVTRTIDHKYRLVLRRQADGALGIEASRTAPAEPNASSRVLVALAADAGDPARWTTVSLQFRVDVESPATRFEARLRLTRDP